MGARDAFKASPTCISPHDEPGSTLAAWPEPHCCCSSPRSPPAAGIARRRAGAAPLTLSVPAGGVVAPARTTTFVYLTAIGRTDVAFELDGAPPFARLTADVIALRPERADRGEYDFTVTARSGDASDSKVLHVSVPVLSNANAAPEGFDYSILDGQLTRPFAPELRIGTIHGLPWISGAAVDRDGDRMHLEVEVVPEGAPFTGTPTHVSGLQYPVNGEILLRLDGVEPGRPFQWRARQVDELDAASPWYPPSVFGAYAWTPHGIQLDPDLSFSIGAPPNQLWWSPTIDLTVVDAGTEAVDLRVALDPPTAEATFDGHTLTYAPPPPACRDPTGVYGVWVHVFATVGGLTAERQFGMSPMWNPYPPFCP